MLDEERLKVNAWLAFYSEDFRSTVNRAYYAVYQAATAISVEHGDAELFPHGWNNPSHEQLPSLIRNNGSLETETRRKVARLLRELRTFREDADYRPGRTILRAQALHCAQEAAYVLAALGVNDNESNR